MSHLLHPSFLVSSSLSDIECLTSEAKYGGTPDLTFSGVAGFGRLPWERCLEKPGYGFDIAVLGMPFDVSRDGRLW